MASLPNHSERDDPFTLDAQLCDDDGIVRGGAIYSGTDYTCTGHAHKFGEHIRCTSPAHGSVGRPGMVIVVRPEPGPHAGTIMSIDMARALEQLGVKPGQWFVVSRGGS